MQKLTLPPFCVSSSRESDLVEVCHKLCICNAVRDALEGEVLSVRFQQLLLKPNKRMVDFILEVKKQTNKLTEFEDVPSKRLICNGPSSSCRFALCHWKRIVSLRRPGKTWPPSWSECVKSISWVKDPVERRLRAFILIDFNCVLILIIIINMPELAKGGICSPWHVRRHDIRLTKYI